MLMAPRFRKRTAVGLARLRPSRRDGLEERKTLVNAEFAREAEMVPRARRRVAAELRQAGCHHLLVDDAETLASELVTNAVRYGAGPQFSITVERSRGEFLIAVDSEPGETSPVRRVASAADERGRGLFLVQALSTRWGTEITPRGAHRTWCLLRDSCPDQR
jgi:anti-sigma regulatory factor (Ser/Thr protein kinase)